MSLEFSTSIEMLELTAIDAQDDLFALSPGWRSPRRMVESVGRVGVLSPLMAEPVGGRLRLVDGFARFRAASTIGLRRVPVMRLAPLTPVRRFVHRLEARLAARPLDELERALALRKMRRQLGVPEHRLVEEILPLMGIRAERFQLRRHLELADIDIRLQQALPTLHTGIALKLSHWGDGEKTLFLGLLDRYRLGVNHQKEIFGWLDEIRQRGGTSARTAVEIWEESGAAAEDTRASLPPQQRLEKIRMKLRTARYPTLGVMEREAERLRAELHLPPAIQLHWPRFFEGELFHIRLSFRSCEELGSAAQSLRNLSASAELQSLVELL